jgi:hypothetical protein
VSCKVESWLSAASNHDIIGATSPACAFDIGRPLELSSQFTRTRTDGEWDAAVAPKAKVNLAPSGIGIFGVAVTATTFLDLTAGQSTGLAAAIPATIRLSENMRINLNAGWLWDRVADRHYATYGAAFDLRTSDNVWTVTAEVFGQAGTEVFGQAGTAVFGQAGTAEFNSVVQPRFQAGLRFRPVDRFNIDLIYGRNIAGENANWITVATVIRFPPPH